MEDGRGDGRGGGKEKVSTMVGGNSCFSLLKYTHRALSHFVFIISKQKEEEDTKDEEATKEEKEHDVTAKTNVSKEENEDPLRFIIGGRGSGIVNAATKIIKLPSLK